MRLRVSVRGTGAPLLLVTGIGASLELAEPFESELVTRGFRITSFDAPGAGGCVRQLATRRGGGALRYRGASGSTATIARPATGFAGSDSTRARAR